LVAAAIAQLPVLQREAIVLFTFEELPIEEIAKITGVDPGAVKSRRLAGFHFVVSASS
jgi:RNA polymerase sigma-70 factor, ECF subfamily